ncbi:hypothetical protein M5K25_018801 [Dendrobium thyrsiflorum]|uniref:Nudix hydrolase domain-containing protein n=1 Tax=Dendrobium thyrsiflorum TaxID=117978 RepID=A0ABD0UDD7_DENTH
MDNPPTNSTIAAAEITKVLKMEVLYYNDSEEPVKIDGRSPAKEVCAEILNKARNDVPVEWRPIVWWMVVSTMLFVGGVDEGEDPRDAAIRELMEETGVSSAEILAEVPYWLTYDFPPDAREKLNKQFGKDWKGQAQKCGFSSISSDPLRLFRLPKVWTHCSITHNVMEHPSQNLVASVKTTQKFEKSPWGFMSKLDSHQGSSDASLFSCSLPALPCDEYNIMDSFSSKLDELDKDVELKDSIGIQGIEKFLPHKDELFDRIMNSSHQTELLGHVELGEDCDLFSCGGGIEMDADL